MRICLLIALLWVAPICQGCNPSQNPETIEVGRDECRQCKMMIVDGRFGGEIVTSKGKVFKFDSFDCLLGFHRQLVDPGEKVFLANFAKVGELISAEQAVITELSSTTSPMGSNHVAFSTLEEARTVLSEPNLTVLRWSDLMHDVEE